MKLKESSVDVMLFSFFMIISYIGSGMLLSEWVINRNLLGLLLFFVFFNFGLVFHYESYKLILRYEGVGK